MAHRTLRLALFGLVLSSFLVGLSYCDDSGYFLHCYAPCYAARIPQIYRRKQSKRSSRCLWSNQMQDDACPYFGSTHIRVFAARKELLAFLVLANPATLSTASANWLPCQEHAVHSICHFADFESFVRFSFQAFLQAQVCFSQEHVYLGEWNCQTQRDEVANWRRGCG